MREGFIGSRNLVLPQMVLARIKSEPLCKHLYVTDMGYYPHASFHFMERLSPIDQYIFIYCIDGCGSYWIGNSDGIREEHNVGANQYFIIPAGRPHCYWADKSDPWTIYWIHFAGSQAGAYGENRSTPSSVNPDVDSRINNRHHLFEEIYNTLMSGYTKENLIYSSVVLQHYLASLVFVRPYRGAVQNMGEKDVVEAAIHFMHENVGRRLKLTDIASYTGLSASYFSMVFRNSTGHSPLEYFNLVKIQEACRLLDYSAMRINQICYKVGIEDCYYFSRLFSKVVGMSPSDYRKRDKQG